MRDTLHFGLTFAGASRRVLRWRRMAWQALRLLGLSALCGAAWSAGKAAETVPFAEPLEAPWRTTDVALCYLITSLCVIIVVMLVANAARERRLRRWFENAEAMELGEAYADEEWNPYAGQWASGGRVTPPVTGLTSVTSLTGERGDGMGEVGTSKEGGVA